MTPGTDSWSTLSLGCLGRTAGHLAPWSPWSTLGCPGRKAGQPGSLALKANNLVIWKLQMDNWFTSPVLRESPNA